MALRFPTFVVAHCLDVYRMISLSIDVIIFIPVWPLNPDMGPVDASNNSWEASFIEKTSLHFVHFDGV